MSSTSDLSGLNNQTHQYFANGGIVIPTGTTSQRPVNPVDGLLRWNRTSKLLEYYGNSVWSTILDRGAIEDRFVEKIAPVILEDLEASGKRLKNVAGPTANGDAVNLGYLNGRFTAGTGINAEFLGGHDQFYYATQFDVQNLINQMGQVQTNLNDHIANKNNPHETNKTHLGLDQVDNTSDLNKPISTATQTALNGKINRSGDVMGGNLSMGFYNLLDVNNFIGAVMWFALDNPPAGFLVANGAAVSRTTYAKLFEKIGVKFGAGNGTTTFNLPDLQNRFVRGSAGGRPVGQTEDHAMVNHTHPLTDPGHVHAVTMDPAGGHIHEIMDGRGGQETDSVSDRKNFAARDSAWLWYNAADVMRPAGEHVHPLTVETKTTGITIGSQTGGASETRPMNIALLPCIMF